MTLFLSSNPFEKVNNRTYILDAVAYAVVLRGLGFNATF